MLQASTTGARVHFRDGTQLGTLADLRADSGSNPGANSGAVNSQPCVILPAIDHNTVSSAATSNASAQQNKCTTSLQRGIKTPKVYTDGIVHYDCFTSTSEPQNLDEALENKNLKQAMDVEYYALMNNKSWHLVHIRKVKTL
jgi:hypothetical protein